MPRIFSRTHLRVQRRAFDEIQHPAAGHRPRRRQHADGTAGIVRCRTRRRGVAATGHVHVVQLFVGRLDLVRLARPRTPVGHETVILRIVEANARGFRGVKRFRQFAAEHDADGRVRAGAAIVEVTPEPAVGLGLVRVAGRLPDFRRAEVRPVRVRITDALHHRELPGVVKIFEAGQRAMKTDLAVHAQNLLRGKPERRARLVIKIAGVGHDGVDAVVAAGHLQHDENRAVLAGDDLRGGIRGLALQARRMCRPETPAPSRTGRRRERWSAKNHGGCEE